MFKRIMLLCIVAILVGVGILCLSDKAHSVNDALGKGLEYARWAGLKGEPTNITIAKMTYLEYRELIEPGFEATDFEKKANGSVWVLEIKGQVILRLPGGTGTEYDNIHIVLSAETGECLEIGARAPGQELHLQGQRVTVEDIGQFPIGGQVPTSPISPGLPTATPLP